MDTYEATVQPFRIKIWLVEDTKGAHNALWRGYIIHVPSGKKCTFENLDDILGFIAPYLEGMGVKLGPVWRIRHQVCKWKLRFR